MEAIIAPSSGVRRPMVEACGPNQQNTSPVLSSLHVLHMTLEFVNKSQIPSPCYNQSLFFIFIIINTSNFLCFLDHQI